MRESRLSLAFFYFFFFIHQQALPQDLQDDLRIFYEPDKVDSAFLSDFHKRLGGNVPFLPINQLDTVSKSKKHFILSEIAYSSRGESIEFLAINLGATALGYFAFGLPPFSWFFMFPTAYAEVKFSDPEKKDLIVRHRGYFVNKQKQRTKLLKKLTRRLKINS